MGNEESISKMCGMSYNIRDEPRLIRQYVEQNYNINYVAQYVDIISKENYNNIEFLEQQSKHIQQNPNYDDWNFTSYANIAYIALNSPPPYNAMFQKLYDDAISYIKTSHKVIRT